MQTRDLRLVALLLDLDAARMRLAEQEKRDPTHEVALAMLGKDVQRAEFRLTEYQALRRSQSGSRR